jgi:hypothetical protein
MKIDDAKEGYLPNIVATARENERKKPEVAREEFPVRKLSPEETLYWMRFFDRPGV